MGQPDLFSSWTCHARPVRSGGRECGHLNVKGLMRRFDGRVDECCEECGCTRFASEDRERRAAEAKL